MSDTIRPTKKQKELLDFIASFIHERGYSPSYREIMNALNYTSVATVALHVGNLIKRGHLRKRDRSARSLEVVNHLDTPPAASGSDLGQENWLIERVEHFFKQIEAAEKLEQAKLDEIYVLVGSLRVLGFEAAAQSFIPRLSAIKQQATIE